MRYESTRGGRTGVSFRTVVLEGLAPDGGLFVPERVDPIDAATLDAWADLSYVDLAAALFRRFVDADEVPDADLRELLSRSYASFDSTNVAPLHEMTGFQVLELFHGPSLSFKDVALQVVCPLIFLIGTQVVGNLFEYFLSRPPRTADEPNPSFLTVVGATSGDTGSAAIYGLRGKKNIQVFILHPKGKVSELQERQMTTVLDDNVHNLAVDGTFDDCQDAVKAMFGDPELRARLNLAAVNSINWARILSQTVYYFWAYFRAGRPRMRFSVPTGNFGDVLAGYYARQLGLPCEGLLVATNANDILHRFFSRGEYHKIGVTATVAPAMDIQVSSNFERFLYHLSGNNAATLTGWMDGFKETGELTLDGALLTKAQATFSSASVSDADAVDAIRRHAAGPSSYVVCPHTACGIVAAERGWLATPSDILTVCLATAHPGKFADVVRSAIAKDVDLPPALAALREMPTRCESVSKDVADIRAIVERVCAQSRPSP